MIAPDQLIGQPCAQQGHEIIGGNERMNNSRGRIGVLSQTAFHHRAGDVAGEDTPHAIVTKAFARFIADNKLNLGRPAVGSGLWRRGHERGVSMTRENPGGVPPGVRLKIPSSMMAAAARSA